MSVSFEDSNLKIWYFNNWQCLFNIKNIYKGYLYSACFLNKPNKYYIVTSSYNDLGEPIYVFNYDKTKKKILKDSEHKTTLIQPYFNQKKTYIIACHEDIIISYDYNNNELFRKYSDNECKILEFQIYKNMGNENIFCLCKDQIIRIWNFNSSELIKLIKFDNIKIKLF